MDNSPSTSTSSSGHTSPRSLSRSPTTPKYKLMICRNWEQGFCRFGEGCKFAHGQGEVKAVNLYYKTRQCKAFHSTGFCKFGDKCQFLHLEKKRLPVFEAIEKKGENTQRALAIY